MKKQLLLALCCCSTGIHANNLLEVKQEAVIASYDLSANELWDGFFAPENIVLVKPSPANHHEFTYNSHPVYRDQSGIDHRLVCIDGGGEGESIENKVIGDPVVFIGNKVGPCTDNFGHVHGVYSGDGFHSHKRRTNVPVHPHLSDYELGVHLAVRECDAFGFDAFPVYVGPESFVELSNGSNNSHYFDYTLTQGLSFDCVLPE